MPDPNDQRDRELDDILEAFREVQPRPQQIEDWRLAVQRARHAQKLRWFKIRLVALPQLASALALGFALGALFFGRSGKPTERLAENHEPSATIEYVYANTE